MKFLSVSKDGGPESNVTAYWLCEFKGLFSICLLRFTDGSRESFHSHAFDSWGWLLKGKFQEQFLFPFYARIHNPSLKPIVVKRSTFHRVVSFGTSWVLNIRGPWADVWDEWNPKTSTYTRLRNGRKIVATFKEYGYGPGQVAPLCPFHGEEIPPPPAT